MARLNVNPTRMELKKLKARLATAVRGHKLLKDKSDEMVRRFSVLIRENRKLRLDVEREMAECQKEFAFAAGMLSPEALLKALSQPASSVEATFDTQNIMSVDVPKIEVQASGGEGYPYAFSEITGEADYAVKRTAKLVESLLHLAEVEKAVAMLAVEIERNKRRVNALEYVMIPQIQETIKYITGKLEENDRAATTRLMKVKSMMQQQEQ